MPLAAASAGAPGRERIEKAVCVHCGTRFVRRTSQAGPASQTSSPSFCCAGCEFVHKLILEHGLERFYELRDSAVLPVKSLVFQKRDYRWLADLAAAAPGSPARLALDLQGVSCIGCVWLIERLFMRRAGALAAHVNSALGQITLRWLPGECDVTDFARELQGFGYLLGPLGDRNGNPHKAFAIRLGVCGAFALNAMLFSVPRYLGMKSTAVDAALFDRCALAFSTLSFFVGGSYFFRSAWNGVRRGWLHIDLPISLGLAAAYAGSILAWSRNAMNFAYFDFVSTFTFLMLAGRWTQQMAVERNRSRLLGMEAGVLTVTAAEGGRRLPAHEITAGALYCLEPGQVAPVRSKLHSDAATLGLDWINGEPETRTTRCGQLVAAGSVNCTQTAITLEAIERWEDSMLHTLLTAKPREKTAGGGAFIKWYVVTVLGLSLLGFGGWLLVGRPLLMAWQVMVSTLVVSCPCAAGVALPLADELAASQLRRRGVFVREQGLWARLARVRKVLFDKTGTLTLETMELRDPAALSALTPLEKSVLLALVQDNLHPASCCLRELLMAARAQPAGAGPAREETGCGIETETPEGRWRLGRRQWAAARAASGEEEGCVFARDGVEIAHFHFREQARPGAAAEIEWLQRRGCTVSILSGDSAEKVRAMAAQLGLPAAQCLGGMSPRDKEDFVRRVDADDTLMIGDGANDSLAFNQSWCAGTPAIDRGLLQSKSDFYFVGRGLSGIRELLLVAAQRRATARRVIAFAIAYNVAAITVAMAGRMNPVLAAVLMPASSVCALALAALGLRERRGER